MSTPSSWTSGESLEALEERSAVLEDFLGRLREHESRFREARERLSSEKEPSLREFKNWLAGRKRAVEIELKRKKKGASYDGKPLE